MNPNRESVSIIPSHYSLSGDVRIAVVISEMGQVLKAWGRDGPPLLHGPAADAAKRARFKPLLVNGKAVKFSGELQYTIAAPK
jgi:Gram-negative bacterial TonB protein C-terminal